MVSVIANSHFVVESGNICTVMKFNIYQWWGSEIVPFTLHRNRPYLSLPRLPIVSAGERRTKSKASFNVLMSYGKYSLPNKLLYILGCFKPQRIIDSWTQSHWNWLGGRVVIVLAFKTECHLFESRKGQIWIQLSFRQWATNYMMLLNNSSTLGNNTTGVWTVPPKNVKKCREA
jgi:hypothetical protein